MKSGKTIVAVTLAATAFLACDKHPVAANVIDAKLNIVAESVTVNLFTLASVGSVTQNILEAPQYISRNENVATVNSVGAITGVGVGSTYIVAAIFSQPNVRDSIRVRVYSDSCGGARPDFGGPATDTDRALFGYDVNAPLNLQKTVQSINNGVEGSSISFNSPDGGLVTGLMWDPVTRPGLRPGVVLMHGYPGTALTMAGIAQTYALAGAVVIAIDASYNHTGGTPLTITPQDRLGQIQVVKDLQRAVDVLRSRPNVDANRIAYLGRSWGGATGALFVGIERRLKAAVLVVGHGGQVSHLTGPIGFKFISNLSCAVRVAWIKAMAPIEPIRFVGNANVPLLLQNGTSDELVPVYEAEELQAAAPPAKTILWYQAPHALNPQALLDSQNWLHEQIGLDAPPGV